MSSLALSTRFAVRNIQNLVKLTSLSSNKLFQPKRNFSSIKKNVSQLNLFNNQQSKKFVILLNYFILLNNINYSVKF